jgi:hypothetical protein
MFETFDFPKTFVIFGSDVTTCLNSMSFDVLFLSEVPFLRLLWIFVAIDKNYRVCTSHHLNQPQGRYQNVQIPVSDSLKAASQDVQVGFLWSFSVSLTDMQLSSYYLWLHVSSYFEAEVPKAANCQHIVLVVLICRCKTVTYSFA